MRVLRRFEEATGRRSSVSRGGASQRACHGRTPVSIGWICHLTARSSCFTRSFCWPWRSPLVLVLIKDISTAMSKEADSHMGRAIEI